VTFFEVRPSCPKCGMNMVKIGSRFECLRCGHVEKPTAAKVTDKATDEGADNAADASGPALSRIVHAAANWPSG
jgi:tRNA(Ile2) C34 agmatinyltransferase TiaS